MQTATKITPAAKTCIHITSRKEYDDIIKLLAASGFKWTGSSQDMHEFDSFAYNRQYGGEHCITIETMACTAGTVPYFC